MTGLFAIRVRDAAQESTEPEWTWYNERHHVIPIFTSQGAANACKSAATAYACGKFKRREENVDVEIVPVEITQDYTKVFDR